MRVVRRLAALIALAATAFGVTGILAAPAALAHPLGNFTVNHYTGLAFVPGHVRVTYVLDLAEIPTFQQRPTIDANGDGTISAAERASWAAAQARAILPQLALTVNGRPVPLGVGCTPAMIFRPGQAGLQILRFVMIADGAVPGSGRVSYTDGTFGDRIGWKEVTARAGDGVTISGSSVPARSVSGELLKYPTNLLQNPLSVTTASLSYTSSRAAGPVPACPTGGTGTPRAAGSSFASLITWRLTPLILVGSLLLAVAFGILHALGPGHGKTITAAYLVGSGAKARQAVGVGIAVSLMHTVSVLTLGVIAVALSSSFPSERIYPWLGLVTGVVALSLGSALLVMRARAYRRGEVAGHGHAHPWDAASMPKAEMALAGHRHLGSAADLPAGWPDHGHEHAEGAAHVHTRSNGSTGPVPDGPDEHPVSRPRLAALAVSGGILPSPTALVVLLGAISAHRVVYGVSLILAFSIGLAGALVAIALLALRARSFVGARLGSRTMRILPIVSALVIVGFGAFFFVRGLTQV